MLAENDVEERSACEVEVLNGGDFASKAQAVEVQEGVKKRVTFCQKFLRFFFSVSFSNDMTIMAFMNFGAISVCSLFVGFSICFQKEAVVIRR